MSSEIVHVEDVKVAIDQDLKCSPTNTRSAKKVTISTEADEILEAKDEQEAPTNSKQVEGPAENVQTDKGEVMWVKYNEPNMTKRINFLYSRLARGLPTKLEAYGMAIGTAVYMAQSVQKTLDGVKFE